MVGKPTATSACEMATTRIYFTECPDQSSEIASEHV
jgi:hypothetical protein